MKVCVCFFNHLQVNVSRDSARNFSFGVGWIKSKLRGCKLSFGRILLIFKRKDFKVACVFEDLG